eukprot:CAMPEP_0202833546 /NCGR_PEP_ID=MMETSP1389-20130828/26312_1 /ASSEMBLY_ACC=CAM_ASM_000865 /TAXON_ID=302021 /ORGANISM="Rhodomonas sp., Strain CCMP768" /LENGTH=41 /DNA_ID= /DNA_START= /DNA_END= /DNA_ORIENTATION=
MKEVIRGSSGPSNGGPWTILSAIPGITLIVPSNMSATWTFL